jgi:hypothetical protein
VASKYGSSSSSQYSKKVTPVSSIYDNNPSYLSTNKKSYVSSIHDNITSENTQGKKLLSMGCEVCQGFYYGKPLTIQEATDKLINPDYVAIA